MTENKTNIITFLDSAYRECYESIVYFLKDDLNVLFSCIRVNRFFCRIFIPILWRNPFRFIKHNEPLIQIFNTLIHCLHPFDRNWLKYERSIQIEELPTPKVYFKYHTYIKEFELNPLIKAMRLWTSEYLFGITNGKYYMYKPKRKGRRSGPNRRKISKRVDKINHHIGNLFFNKGGQYNSLNIFYNDLLSGPNSLIDICEFRNYGESLINVDKLSLGFFNQGYTDLIPLITKKFFKLQQVLSPNIQHLQIYIDTNKNHPELSRNFICFIKSQNCLKSLLTNIFWEWDKTNSFLDALGKHSKSLTFFRLEDKNPPILITTLLSSIFDLLPHLTTLELPMISNDIQIPTLPFNDLEHLCYNYWLDRSSRYRVRYGNPRPIELYKRILLSTSTNLKSLKIDDVYCPLVPCGLNLTHFHIVMDKSLSNERLHRELMDILGNLHQLVHLKLTLTTLNSSFPQYPQSFKIIKETGLYKSLSQTLSHSLKILEVNFPIVDENLEILFYESKFNLQCIKLYHYEYEHQSQYLGPLVYQETSLRVFIDYAKKRKCLRELGITKGYKFPEELIKEAQNHFIITKLNAYEINNPFYGKLYTVYFMINI